MFLEREDCGCGVSVRVAAPSEVVLEVSLLITNTSAAISVFVDCMIPNTIASVVLSQSIILCNPKCTGF